MRRTLYCRWAAVILAARAPLGCSEDARLVRVAEEAADRQAGQNREMAQLNREVAEGTKRLVEAEAQSRKEVIALQQDLRADQADVHRARDRLEVERKQIAAQRHRDPIIANAITGVGLLLACLTPLLLCWYLLRTVREESDGAVVAEVLIEELMAEHPKLLGPLAADPAQLASDQPVLSVDADGDPDR